MLVLHFMQKRLFCTELPCLSTEASQPGCIPGLVRRAKWPGQRGVPGLFLRARQLKLFRQFQQFQHVILYSICIYTYICVYMYVWLCMCVCVCIYYCYYHYNYYCYHYYHYYYCYYLYVYMYTHDMYTYINVILIKDKLQESSLDLNKHTP